MIEVLSPEDNLRALLSHSDTPILGERNLKHLANTFLQTLEDSKDGKICLGNGRLEVYTLIKNIFKKSSSILQEDRNLTDLFYGAYVKSRVYPLYKRAEPIVLPHGHGLSSEENAIFQLRKTFHHPEDFVVNTHELFGHIFGHLIFTDEIFRKPAISPIEDILNLAIVRPARQALDSNPLTNMY